MDEKQTIEQIKTRLSKFLEDIDHVNPDEVSVKAVSYTHLTLPTILRV